MVLNVGIGITRHICWRAFLGLGWSEEHVWPRHHTAKVQPRRLELGAVAWCRQNGQVEIWERT